MKYSCPLAELEIKFERHTNKERGKFSGASGSSQANFVSPEVTWSTANFAISSFVVLPCFFASSANSKLLLLNCG